jgi:hypothetical protein
MASQTILAELPEVFVSTKDLSTTVSRAVRRGELREIGPKLYTKNLRDAPEQIVRRHIWQIIASFVPGALIADRTALESRPARDGSVFVVADRKRDVELPGLIIRPRKGPGPLPTDQPFIGDLFLSSPARAYLDNLAPSRQREGRVARTFGRAELETYLDDKLRTLGIEALNKIRDQARQIAPLIAREAEFHAFDGLVAAMLGTRDVPLLTERARTRHSGQPYDPDRLNLFEALHRELRSVAPVMRGAQDRSEESRTTLAFFEAYFSNFIEGTQFLVEEATDIVFNGVIPRARPADAHDIIGTWRVVSDPVEMARRPTDPSSLCNLLKRRHAILMAARSDKSPGEFKHENNQAGGTLFVDWGHVEGTLAVGFDLYRSLDTAFARAVYMMFLVSEVHPFTDGNGRIARIMMNAELVAANEERIIIPTIYRDNYIAALRALSRTGNPAPIVRALDFAQRWVAFVPWGNLRDTEAELTRQHVFTDSAEAENLGLRLRIPT